MMLRRLLILLCTAITLAILVILYQSGIYGLNVLLRHGGTYWITVNQQSERLSPSMRLAIAGAPAATPGILQWNKVAEGFETGELPVIADGHEVDRILLARIDPAQFRFAVYNAPAGDRDLDTWMNSSGAALIVNGSYYSYHGLPDTPLLSEGKFLGPAMYDAKAGAFVASSSFTGIHDLSVQSWQSVFKDVQNAMVSYPLLIKNGISTNVKPSRWLANRSFVGQEKEGRIVIGTTKDAFFSLDRFAGFLQGAPLNLTMALNLDGGPVACQSIKLNGYSRKTYGRWEAQVEENRVKLLTWPYGTIPMPVVLAVFPKS